MFYLQNKRSRYCLLTLALVFVAWKFELLRISTFTPALFEVLFLDEKGEVQEFLCHKRSRPINGIAKVLTSLSLMVQEAMEWRQ